MLRLFQLTSAFIKLGFCATVIVNLLFINLTLSYTKNITGTYRKMLVIFAATSILFSVVEVIAQPCLHNFNAGAVYFSLRDPDDSLFSMPFLYFSLLLYGSCYLGQVAFIAVQFLFRYFTLTTHPMQKSFQGRKQFFWALYVFLMGGVFGGGLWIFLPNDQYSDVYMEKEMQRVYLKDIKKVPRIIALAYEGKEVRWNMISYTGLGMAIVTLQYLIITFCSLKMYTAIKTNMNVSPQNQKLELQFFQALTLQIILPTLLITLPTGFVLLVPLLNTKVSCQFGIIFALYSWYPIFDTVSTMVILKEYKRCLRDCINDLYEFTRIKEEETPETIQNAGIEMAQFSRALS